MAQPEIVEHIKLEIHEIPWIIAYKGKTLTVEPAFVFAEARSEERFRGILRKVVEYRCDGGDDDRHTPGVNIVDTHPNQLLTLLHWCGSEITEKEFDNNR